jgi:hypothetical protein
LLSDRTLPEPFRKSCSCLSPKASSEMWLLIRREPQWTEVNQSFSFVFATPKKGFEHEQDAARLWFPGLKPHKR